MPPAELVKICLQLAKYKKENKELLAYLLFDSNYEPEFVARVKAEIEMSFGELNRNTLYFAKKGIRKVLKTVNRYARYSGLKRTEVDLRIHFCANLCRSGIPVVPGTATGNIFDGQLLKIRKLIAGLHEDLQHDYNEEIRELLRQGHCKAETQLWKSLR